MIKTTLDNGLIAIVKHFPSEYASLHIDVGFGNFHEAQGIFDYNNVSLIGANHFIEHLVFGDTRRYSSEEIAELDSLCRETNAEEGTISTDYWVNLFSSQDLDHILSKLTSILFGAWFKLEEIETERGTILSEIRIAKDNVTDISENSFLTDLFCKTMYQKHPFKFPVLGTEDTVRNLERKVLFDLYQKYYVPNNMILSIVGGIDEEKTIDIVRKHFSCYEKGNLPELKSVDEPKNNKPQEVPFKANSVNQTYLLLGIRTIPQTHKDFPVLEVIEDILCGGSYSRLFREIRRKRGYAYSPETKLVSVADEGYFRIYSQAPPTQEGADEVKKIILDNLIRLAQEPVTEQELNISKKDLLGAHQRMLVDLEDLGHELTWHERLGIGVEAYDIRPEKINAVTPEDIKMVAEKYLNPKSYVLVGIKPKES